MKAWCSDVAVEVASLGVQVHGGMGFIDDAEISQVYRDSRIGPIFEGTNYIQAQDLLGRKVIRDRGAVLGELLAQIESAAHAPGHAAPASGASAQAPSNTARTSDASAQAPGDAARTSDASTQAPADPLAFLRAQLRDGCARLRDATAELLARSATEPDLVGATAYHFLHWVGTLIGGWQLALLAERARSELSATEARALADLAAFYGAHIMPRMLVHEAAVRHGVETISNVAPAEI